MLNSSRQSLFLGSASAGWCTLLGMACVSAVAVPCGGESRRPIGGQVVEAESTRPIAGADVQILHFIYDVEGDPPIATTMHRTVLTLTKSDGDGKFATGLVAEGLPSGRVTAVAWSKEFAGYLDWSMENQWELQHDQLPPVRIQMYPRGYKADVVAHDGDGRPVSGVRMSVVPAWESWDAITRQDLSGEWEYPEFLQACELWKETGENGSAAFETLPFVQDDPEDCVYWISTADESYVSEGSYYEIGLGERPTCRVRVALIADLLLEGYLIDEEGERIHSGSIQMKDSQVGEVDENGEWRIKGGMLGSRPWTLIFSADGFQDMELMLSPDALLHGKEIEIRLAKS